MVRVLEAAKRSSGTRESGLFLALILVGCIGVTYGPASFASPPAQRAEPPQSRRSQPQAESPAAGAHDIQVDPEAMDATRRRLNDTLDRYPRVANVIYRDPSLLGNQEYITSNAPGLWPFLEQHPEISRDPEFFLNGHLRRFGFIEHEQSRDDVRLRFLSDLWPFMVFVIVVIALLWILRVILENRRWSRLAKVQAEVHGKLLEKFSGSQDVLAYMATEPGRRFLESAPIPTDLEQRPRFSAPVGRILWSLQVGLIVGLAGVGMLYIRGSVPEGDQPLLVVGTLGATLGVGFILSAIASYALSHHLGLFERAPSPTLTVGGLGREREQ